MNRPFDAKISYKRGLPAEVDSVCEPQHDFARAASCCSRQIVEAILLSCTPPHLSLSSFVELDRASSSIDAKVRAIALGSSIVLPDRVL